MQSSRRLRTRRICYLFSLFLLGSLCADGHGQTLAQSTPVEDKVLFHLNGGKNSPPVKIVQLMLDQKEIPLDTPVPVEGMWMRKISVVVQNISPKTIVKAGIMIWFPETRAVTNGPVPAVTMSLGRFPQRAFIRRDGTIPPYNAQVPPEIRIAPGELMTFTRLPNADEMQTKAYSLSGHITKANINFDTFYFEDDSKWLAGQYYLAVPPPVIWQPVAPAEFFGTSTSTPQ